MPYVPSYFLGTGHVGLSMGKLKLLGWHNGLGTPTPVCRPKRVDENTNVAPNTISYQYNSAVCTTNAKNPTCAMISCPTMEVWTMIPETPLRSANPGERAKILIVFRLVPV